MNRITQYFNNSIPSPDERVSDWVFMSTPWPMLSIISFYLFTIYGILPIYMKNRKPYKLTKIIRVYNILQIIINIIILYQISTSGWIQGTLSLYCQPVDYSNRPESVTILRAMYWTYYLKMSELIETVFFILRNKTNQISVLHIYHHTSTFFMSWVACKYVGGGMASVPVMLNCSVHIFMYLYYYLSSLGPSWQKKLAPWKPRLTMIQMIQFTLILLHSATNLRPKCHYPRILATIFIPNIIFLYRMFYDFYQQNYCSKKGQ